MAACWFCRDSTFFLHLEKFIDINPTLIIWPNKILNRNIKLL